MILKPLVKDLLRYYPELRDNDKALFREVYFRDSILKKLDHKRFLIDFEKHYSHPESIRSARQQLQREFPTLQGKKYSDRQKYGKEVSMAMRENPSYSLQLG